MSIFERLSSQILETKELNTVWEDMSCAIERIIANTCAKLMTRVTIQKSRCQNFGGKDLVPNVFEWMVETKQNFNLYVVLLITI